MSFLRKRRGGADLAAMEGRHIGVDGLMTGLSFILLFIIVVAAVVFLLVKYLSQNIDVPALYEKIKLSCETALPKFSHVTRIFGL